MKDTNTDTTHRLLAHLHNSDSKDDVMSVRLISNVLTFINEERLNSNGSKPVFETLEEVEKEAIDFANSKLRIVGTLVSTDYRCGYREGIEHYLQDKIKQPKNS